MKYLTDIWNEIVTWCHNGVEPEPQIESIKYGALYNWYAATDERNICAEGWHIPTKDEFDALITYLGGSSLAGDKLKESGIIYWDTPNSGNNSSLFNARGAGHRGHDDGLFVQQNLTSYFWTTTTHSESAKYMLWLSYNLGSAVMAGYYMAGGASIRPIKDSTTLTNGQTGTYTGNDGKVYRTICIGTQEWLADNLAETKYRDGSDIPIVTDNSDWAALTTGAMCYYDNDINKA